MSDLPFRKGGPFFCYVEDILGDLGNRGKMWRSAFEILAMKLLSMVQERDTEAFPSRAE